MKFVSSVTPPTPLRLDSFLAAQTKLSRTFIQSQIAAGRVSVNGSTLTKASTKLKPGDTVWGDFEESIAPTLEPVAKGLDILFEDEELLVLNKPQGVVVHPAAGHSKATLVHYLLHHLRENADLPGRDTLRPGIVHRLDIGTSGVMVIAKNRLALDSLGLQFKTRTVSKLYQAIVWGTAPNRGTVQGLIGRDRQNRKKMSSQTDQGRDSLTHWETIQSRHGLSHVLVRPHTGRTHQIRVHLSESRLPVVGDKLYGGRCTPGRILRLPEPLQNFLSPILYPFLHAQQLTLVHPLSAKPMTFTAPAPSNFQYLFGFLQAPEQEPEGD